MASKHAETVKESEKQMRILQQERQAVFQDAFQSDLQYYREVGKIPSMYKFLQIFFFLILIVGKRTEKLNLHSFSRSEIEIEKKAVQQTLSLEEVVLDNELENKELDKFLEE